MSKLFVLVLMIGSITGCHREASTIITMYFENQSGKDIVVINTKRPDKEPVYIPNGATYTESWGEEGGESRGPFYTARNIDVIFDNERIINYDVRDRDIFNNPLFWGNYEKVVVKENKNRRMYEYEYYYTFVPEQYEMAEPYDPDTPTEPEE